MKKLMRVLVLAFFGCFFSTSSFASDYPCGTATVNLGPPFAAVEPLFLIKTASEPPEVFQISSESLELSNEITHGWLHCFKGTMEADTSSSYRMFLSKK